jgi:hypothetical protein
MAGAGHSEHDDHAQDRSADAEHEKEPEPAA